MRVNIRLNNMKFKDWVGLVGEKSVRMAVRNIQLLHHPSLGSMIRGVWELNTSMRG